MNIGQFRIEGVNGIGQSLLQSLHPVRIRCPKITRRCAAGCFSHGLAVLKRRARQAGGESHLRYRRGTIITLLCHQRWLGGKSPPSMEVLIENHGTKWGSFQPCLPEMIISRIKIDPEKCQLLADTIVWGHTQLMSWQGLWELDGGGWEAVWWFCFCLCPSYLFKVMIPID